MQLKTLIAICLFIALAFGQKFCPTDIYQRVKWPRTQEGQQAQGSCAPGFKLPDGVQPPTRRCQGGGVWATNTQNTCVVDPEFCGPDIYQNSAWESTYKGTTAIGNCQPGFIVGPNGPPQRLCQPGGLWSKDVKPQCIPSGGYCPSEVSGNAEWQRTQKGKTVQGRCLEERGWSGKPTRTCSTGSHWGGVRNPCNAFCPAEVISAGPWSGIKFASVFAGTSRAIKCAKGGGLIRTCNANPAYNPNDPKSEPAEWGVILNRACKR